MNPHFKPYRSSFHVSNVKRIDNDPIVQNGLAVTPAQMLELTHQGFAISAQNARMMADASTPNVGEVPLEHTRHFDMADAYQAMKEVHVKARKAVDGLRKGDILPLDTRVKRENVE